MSGAGEEWTAMDGNDVFVCVYAVLFTKSMEKKQKTGKLVEQDA